MAVNRFFQRTPYDIGLYVPPVEVIAETMKMNQEKFDRNYLLTEELKNHFIESLPQDRALANKLQQDWSKQIDDMVAKHSGNYAAAGKDIISLMSNIKKQYNPGGQAHAITSNLTTYKDWLTRSQERVAKGEVLAGDMNLANEYFMKGYTGVGEIDPVSGTFNRMQVEDLATFKDPDSVIQKVLPGFKPEKHKVGESYLGGDGMIHYREREREGLNPQKLYRGFAPALSSDAELNAYYGQKAKFMGLDPSQVAQGLDDYAKQRAMSLGYENTSDIHKMQRDPAYIARLKASLDKENIDYQYGLMQYGQNVEGTGQGDDGDMIFNHDDWRSDPLGKLPAEAYATRDEFGRLNPNRVDPSKNYTEEGQNNASMEEFINNPKYEHRLKDRNINPHLARSYWEVQKQMAGPEFKKLYGKDKKYTDKFEKDFAYNLKNEYNTKHRYYRTFEGQIPNQKAHNIALTEALRLGLNGGSMIYLPGNPVGQQSIPKDILESFYDEKTGKIKNEKFLNVTTIKPQRGINTAGWKISTPGGSFIVEDPSVSRSEIAMELKGAFFPLHYEGAAASQTPIAFERDPKTGNKNYTAVDAATGKGYTTYPTLEYVYNKQTNSMDEFYGFTTNPKDPKNNRVTVDGKPVLYTMDQLLGLYDQDFQGMFGTGASKSDKTWFSFGGNNSMYEGTDSEMYNTDFNFDN